VTRVITLHVERCPCLIYILQYTSESLKMPRQPWQPPPELQAFLQYNEDGSMVRCTVCATANLPGIGGWLKTGSLKQHIRSAKHAQLFYNHQHQGQEPEEDVSQAALDAAYSAPAISAPYNVNNVSSTSRSHIPMFTSPEPPPHDAYDMSPLETLYTNTQALNQLSMEFKAVQETATSAADLRAQFEDLLRVSMAQDMAESTGFNPEDLLDPDTEGQETGLADLDEDVDESDWGYIPPSEYWPYPNRTVMLLDILDNLARCRFSRAQMELILFLLRTLGVSNVPSYKSFRKLQTALQPLASSPVHSVSSQGNHFYVNDIRETIAHDFANPLTAVHLHLYPEEADGPISETWQAACWKEFAPAERTPMYSASDQQFWIDELCEMDDGTFGIPCDWVVRQKKLTAMTKMAEPTQRGWALTGEVRQVLASSFRTDYSTLLAALGPDSMVWNEPQSVPEMPNPLRKLVEPGEDLFVVMVSPWADDVSGNKSKQYNKHMNMYTTNGCLPGRLTQQEFHTHFVSTSPSASSTEQFGVFRDQVNATQTNPHRCFDARSQRVCQFIIRCPGLFADNPQQSDESSHMGGNANFPCHKCHWGGTQIEKEGCDGYHNCHLVDIKRNAGEIRAELQAQLKTAMRGVKKDVEDMQHKLGTKDKITQLWIEELLKHAQALKCERRGISQEQMVATLTEWLEKEAGEKMNPLLDIAGLDPSQDTPVEILHTILLGIIKYIWHHLNTAQWNDEQRALLAIRLQSTDLSGLNVPPLRASYMVQYRNNLIGKHFKTLMQTLPFHIYDITTQKQFQLVKAAADLGARLWVPEIDNMDEYIVSG
jgi:hypothetical protein